MLAPPLADNVIGSPDGGFMIAEWSDPGGPPGPPRLIAPLHVHHRDDEAWYVLEGTLCIRMDDNVVEARAGSCVLVKRGTAHAYWNPGPGIARYLLVMTPRIFRLIEEIHAMNDRDSARLAALFEKHESQLLP